MADNSSKNTTNIERKYYVFAMKIAGDFGATIAVPVVIFTLIGQKLDTIYHTKSLYLVIGMILAAILTAKMIYTKSKKYGQQFQDLDKKI